MITKEDIADMVRDIVISQRMVLEYRYSRDKAFDKMGADSLDAVELVIALEDAYGIEISDDEGWQIKTPTHAEIVVFDKLARKGEA